MTAAAALARAHAAGLALVADGDRLRWRGPQPPPDLLADLRAHKAEVLALLAADNAATTVPASPKAEPPHAWGLTAPDRAAAMARLRAPTLPSASPEQAADEAADRDAIAAEPLLPNPGTPERERLDNRKRDMVAGLLLGFERHRACRQG